MRITNKHDLPEPVYQAIINDPYTKGDADYSVTQLIAPIQASILTKGHADELEEDAMDRVWTLFGKAMHKVLEAGAEFCVQSIHEQRFSAKYAGKVVSGQVDYGHDEAREIVLWDYKVTSVWSIIFEDGKAKPDWITQMNWYANLAEQSSNRIRGLKILVILRDWSAGELKRRKERNKIDGYPETPIVVLDVPMALPSITNLEITKRVQDYEAALADPDNLPECTAEERWEQPQVTAVYKDGNKKATKLFKGEKQEGEAMDFLATKPEGHYMDVRPGRSTRCEDYCLAAPFCKQFKAMKEQGDS